jgi:hypothetical protein
MDYFIEFSQESYDMGILDPCKDDIVRSMVLAGSDKGISPHSLVPELNPRVLI